MARARISDEVGLSAIEGAASATAPRDTMATAVRYSLQVLSERASGNTVEVRVPPFGAVQCIEGPRHTRGTPPNVVEMSASVWIALATGRRTWADARESGAVQASGSRADLTAVLPLWPGLTPSDESRS